MWEKDCPILTPRILRKLIESERGRAWEILAEAADAQVVVSSDKNASYFDQMGHPDIVLYVHEDPESHVGSRMARTSEGVREATAWYTDHSLRRLKWVSEAGKPAYSVYLPFLGDDPSGMMQSLAQLVGDNWKRGVCSSGSVNNITLAEISLSNNGIKFGSSTHPCVAVKLMAH